MKIVLCALMMMVASGEPFLYNSGQAIISSIFSASAHPGESNNGNIEDLRIMKEQKNSIKELEAEESDLNEKSATEEHEQNEATPSLIHKKIGKILTKLQLFSALRNTIHSRRQLESTEEVFSNEENDISKDLNLLVSNTSEPVTNVYKITNRAAFMPPQSPDRITLYPTAEDQQQSNETMDDEPEDTKISLTTGNVGVYFMELLGGLATLIYGAALQVANAASGGSSPPASNV